MTIPESKRRNNDKYNLKCDYISLRPLKPIGERIRLAAKDSGKSLQGYILDAVNRQIAEDEDGQEIPSSVIANSMQWLKEHGHSADEIVDFLQAIAKEDDAGTEIE